MKTGKLTLTALLLALSFAISLFESFIPVNAIFPIPGLKLGIANVAVMAAICFCGKKSALAVTVLRPLLTFILFGNVTSFILSFSGGLFAFAALVATQKLRDRVFSFGGISVISAVMHSVGQIVAACFVVYDTAVLFYLPLLCAASCATGLLNGIIMNGVLTRIPAERREKI